MHGDPSFNPIFKAYFKLNVTLKKDLHYRPHSLVMCCYHRMDYQSSIHYFHAMPFFFSTDFKFLIHPRVLYRNLKNIYRLLSLGSTEAITTFQIWDTIPFHSQKMMLKPLVFQKELYPCRDEKTSMHIVPKCVQSIYSTAENLQQPYHICFPSLLCTNQYQDCLLPSTTITT